MNNQIPDFTKQFRESIEEVIPGIQREMLHQARANIARLGLVRSGALLRSQQTRVRFRKIQLGTDLDYPNIHNYGGTVRQKAWHKAEPKRPRKRQLVGKRVFDVQRKQYFGPNDAATLVNRAQQRFERLAKG